ncbi:MAG: serpin family protein [Chlamydiales bacterium]
MLLKKMVFGLLFATLPLLSATKEEQKVQKLSQECGDFGFSLYKVLNNGSSPNLIYSPYSIFSCLSMVSIGAREDTATEMQQALHLTFNRTDLPKAASLLAKYLTTPVHTSYTLDVANGLWLDRDSFVLADYRHALEEGYRANIQSLDFSKTEEATALINEWVSNETHGKISRLLQANDLDGSTRMVLTNAVYFQGSWQKPFDAKKTKESDFYPDSETTMPVQMMEQTASFLFLEDESMQVLSLPFLKKDEKSTLACLIFLPKKGKELSDIEKLMSNELLSRWVGGLHNERVHVKMPKFQLDSRTDLNAPLAAIGIKTAFTEKANFSGIDGMRDLFLSRVVHQAFFSLDELGVVAAAATAASMNVTATPPASPLRQFIVDRPFLLLLVDLNTKLPLFIVKIQEPNCG